MSFPYPSVRGAGGYRLRPDRAAAQAETQSRAPEFQSPQPQAQQLDDLTPREREVLKSIAEGSSTKQTAARLGITFKTAAFHRYKIMQKLGVHETSSLVRFAIRSGLIAP